MQNKLSDLNNHLFAQLERLGEEELKGEALEKELKRTEAITGVAREIIRNAQLALDVETELSGINSSSRPKMLS